MNNETNIIKNNIKEVVTMALSLFKTQERDGKKILVIDYERGNEKEKAIAVKIFDAMHASFNFPHDYSYEWANSILQSIDESIDSIPGTLEENASDEIYNYLIDNNQIEADIYTSDLTEWLHVSNDNVYFLTEVLEEYGELKDGFQLLACAQLKAKQEFAQRLIEELFKEVE